jgi:hypothetical protein
MSFQARADDMLQKWGVRAPAPALGETGRDYRVRVMRMIARRLPGDNQLRHVPWKRCDDAALNAFEPELFAAAEAAVHDTRFMEPGEMREVVERDPKNNQEIHRFIGPQSFVRNPLYGHRECGRVIGGLFQRDVGWLQQGVNDRALRQGIPQHDTKRNTFGNSRE